jgi:long-chain acyl-CoA synthetase
MTNINIYQIIKDNSELNSSKVAVIIDDNQVTYQQLIKKVDNVAMGLSALGMNLGDRVALCCSNSLDFVTALLAGAKLGLIIVPLPLTMKGTALEKALTGASCQYAIAWYTVAKQIQDKGLLKSSAIITLGSSIDGCLFYNELLECPTEMTENTVKVVSTIDSSADFILTMTSGSTGSPKPIIFTQKTKIDRAFKATIDYYQLSSNDTVLVATPLYHSLAQRSLLMPLMLGATVVILPKFSIQAWLNSISEHRVSFLFAVSSQLVALLPELSRQDKAHDFSSLQCLVSSSAPLNETDKQLLLSQLKCHFHECYGASEVGVVTDFDITEKNVPLASVGRALPDIQLKICDENRKVLAYGKIGEIACLTPTRFKGYFNLPEQTQASFDDAGYFYTGDLGYLDEQGYLYFVGRTKDVIKSGGINVYPQDIESVLIELPQIKECAAVGIVDDKFGEVIWVAYVLENDDEKSFDEKKLMLQAMQQLTDYQQPRFYQRFTQFPKSALGKILKPEIKAELIAIKYL